MLEIKNLHVKVDDVMILKGLNLSMGKGEIHAIMGANGAGKSTLAKVIGGHPDYEVLEGEIIFQGQDILEMEPEERAHLGLFISFQYPLEIAGVSNFEFLLTAHNALRKAASKEAVSREEFRSKLQEKLRLLKMDEKFLDRSVNEGFSGGEKKRNEILQMAALNPQAMILDETDSGLDIDAMKVVAQGVKQIMSQDKSLLLITHYQRLLDYIQPDFVHVMLDGRIVKTAGPELALKLEEQGYDWLEGQASTEAVEGISCQ